MKDIESWIIKYHNRKISKSGSLVYIIIFFSLITFLLISLLLSIVMLHKLNNNLFHKFFSNHAYIKLFLNFFYLIIVLLYIFIFKVIIQIKSKKRELYLHNFLFLVHENPSIGSKAIGYLKEGEEFYIIDKSDYEEKWYNGWYKISYKKEVGWKHE